MKRYLLFYLIFTCLIFSGCNNPAEQKIEKKPVKPSETNVQPSAPTTPSAQKEFTLEELSKYNGKNGNSAYVAVDGKVYDVTHAEKWKDGMHKDGIRAGKDLTLEISKSPHGKSVLSGLPVVGTLKK